LTQFQPQKRVRKQDAAQFFSSMPCLSPRTVALPPCLPLDTKDSLKEARRFFDKVFFAEGRIAGGRF
jgi:hypothetical protein